MEDGNEPHDNDVPFHQDGKTDSSEAAAVMDMARQYTQSNIIHHDTSEPNSNQMHMERGTTEDTNEDFQGFELHEDHLTDSAPNEYLFTGGGFCTEEGDAQDPAGVATGAEIEHGTNDAFRCIDGVPDGGKENANMEAKGESSSQRPKAGRGLSAMPTLTKRRRKS